MACGILVPQPGIKSAPLAVEAQTTREVPTPSLEIINLLFHIHLCESSICPNTSNLQFGKYYLINIWVYIEAE